MGMFSEECSSNNYVECSSEDFSCIVIQRRVQLLVDRNVLYLNIFKGLTAEALGAEVSRR